MATHGGARTDGGVGGRGVKRRQRRWLYASVAAVAAVAAGSDGGAFFSLARMCGDSFCGGGRGLGVGRRRRRRRRRRCHGRQGRPCSRHGVPTVGAHATEGAKTWDCYRGTCARSANSGWLSHATSTAAPPPAVKWRSGRMPLEVRRVGGDHDVRRFCRGGRQRQGASHKHSSPHAPPPAPKTAGRNAVGLWRTREGGGGRAAPAHGGGHPGAVSSSCRRLGPDRWVRRVQGGCQQRA